MDEKINKIIKEAEHKIYQETGKTISLLPSITFMACTPEQMLHRIASILGFRISDFFEKTRQRDYVDMKSIACLLLKKFYPDLVLIKIAKMMGTEDHTMVIHYCQRGEQLLEIMDARFMYKYKTVLKEIWESE